MLPLELQLAIFRQILQPLRYKLQETNLDLMHPLLIKELTTEISIVVINLF